MQHSGWHAAARAPPLSPPPLAAWPPEAAAPRTTWQRWRARWPLFLLLALMISGVTALVILAKRGVFTGTKSAGAQPPLDYYQRPRASAAAAAFNASLHPMLLPEELAAAGAPTLSADVIVVGAGAAGLAAAGLLARNTSVLLLEARVSEEEGVVGGGRNCGWCVQLVEKECGAEEKAGWAPDSAAPALPDVPARAPTASPPLPCLRCCCAAAPLPAQPSMSRALLPPCDPPPADTPRCPPADTPQRRRSCCRTASVAASSRSPLPA